MKRFTLILMASLTAASSGCDRDETPTLDNGEVTPPTSEKSEATELLNESANLLEQMKADAELRQVMSDARGIFLVPDYGRAAAVVGARGGEGVLVVKTNGSWSSPLFYDLGGISIGAQAGAKGGDIAMLLMNDNAVAQFKDENNFSLNAAAGLTFVAWDARAQGSAGRGDVIFWSDTEGLFAGVDLSATDISFDEDETKGLYGQDVPIDDVFSGKSKSPQNGGALQNALKDL